jgi:translation initiation factor IF-3
LFNNQNQNQNPGQKKREYTPINHQIRTPRVLCIDHLNNNLGEISTSEALKIANEQGLDLVQVSFNSKQNLPTCKILDYSKYKYQQSKNQKAAAKKQRENEIKLKEIKFRPCTDINDLKTKANKAQEFLDEGHNVKVSIVFKGREITHQDLARETLNQFMDFLPETHFMNKPTILGKILSVMLVRKNNDHNE